MNRRRRLTRFSTESASNHDQAEIAVRRVGSSTCAVSSWSRLDAAPWSTLNAGSQVDGRSWQLALRKRVLEQLGMTDTEPMIASPVYARIAQSYVPQHDDRFYHRGASLAVARKFALEAASGCIASTPLDMARYMSMFINRGMGPTRRVLQEVSFEALATSHVPAGEFGPNAGYGYGFAIDKVDGHTILRHTGGMTSFMSAMHIDLDAGFGAFASVNAQALDVNDRVLTPVPSVEATYGLRPVQTRWRTCSGRSWRSRAPRRLPRRVKPTTSSYRRVDCRRSPARTMGARIQVCDSAQCCITSGRSSWNPCRAVSWRASSTAR